TSGSGVVWECPFAFTCTGEVSRVYYPGITLTHTLPLQCALLHTGAGKTLDWRDASDFVVWLLVRLRDCKGTPLLCRFFPVSFTHPHEERMDNRLRPGTHLWARSRAQLDLPSHPQYP